MAAYLSSHPRGMWILCLAELCDRLAFYGALSVLVIYLTTHFGLSDIQAYAIFGIYTTLGFATPVIGGFLADKYLGLFRSIVIGGLLIAIGCAVLALHSLFSLYIGLSIVICGIGLLKSSVTTQLGLLYGEDNPNKGAGYTLFYMGMNLGAIIGPVIFGLLAFKTSYQLGFLSAGLLMLLSTVLYLSKFRFFMQFTIKNHDIKQSPSFYFFFSIGIIFFAFSIAELFKYAQYFGDILLPFGIVILALIAVLTFAQKDQQVRLNILKLVLLTVLSIFYFACAKQTESSLLLFINRDIDHEIFNWNIPTVAFASIKPMFIVLFALLFAPLWQWYCKNHKAPPVLLMVAAGLLLGAASFVIFALSANAHIVHGFNLPLYGIIAGFFLLGMGELCIMPSVTTAVSNLAPKAYQSTFMGIWFLSLAFSGYMASVIAKMSTTSVAAHQTISFAHTFWEIAGLTGFVAVVACSLYPFFRPKALS